MKRDCFEKRIGYPRTGASLAGGRCNIISQTIDDELQGEEYILVDFVNPKQF
ncbi:hypothetical protein J8L98_21935 [Pseudoalteromonas sp. MMG013]|uniref:hypothetical protein n=1 Tax=Pseudoalteromonas sp. MMG013 TaxID=2822687 RepID=UPI001B390941|nr:hypothetical protein [Pseudoalteromonas sp. MMG013]MBQ4864355.1 hypothetical protein [Pseudoalteromonas sp. MMG013]